MCILPDIIEDYECSCLMYLLYLYQKEEILELRKKTNEVGTHLGSVGAFISFYQKKYESLSENFELFRSDVDKSIAELDKLQANVKEGSNYIIAIYWSLMSYYVAMSFLEDQANETQLISKYKDKLVGKLEDIQDTLASMQKESVAMQLRQGSLYEEIKLQDSRIEVFVYCSRHMYRTSQQIHFIRRSFL